MSKVIEREWSYEKIKNGCILSGIAHAIAVAKFPEISYEHSWDGINYNIQNSEGIRGTITFGKKLCVAAFRNETTAFGEIRVCIPMIQLKNLWKMEEI